MNNILQKMLEKYEIKNEQDEINAMKEIIQEIVLSGLSRGGFFDEAAFYGGTALRIFYGLDRFSEDLDFALIKPNANFDLAKYFGFIETEVKSYGLNLKILKKEKSNESNITSAFLKGNTMEHILLFFADNNYQVNDKLLKDIKIKFEVDVNPPGGASYEFKYQLLPAPYQVRIYDLPSLFSGKIHAILCRKWGLRTKGRDLYDYIFFLSLNTKVNMSLIKNKLIESKYIKENELFNVEKLKELLKEKFKEINYDNAREDVKPFIKNISSLDLWNSDFFIEITDKIE